MPEEQSPRLRPLRLCALRLFSPAQPLPAIPALPRTHRRLRKNSISYARRNESKSDDAGKSPLPRNHESRDNAAKRVVSPLRRSTVARNTSANPHRAFARAKYNPPVRRRDPLAPLPGNTAQSISAATDESPPAPLPC